MRPVGMLLLWVMSSAPQQSNLLFNSPLAYSATFVEESLYAQNLVYIIFQASISILALTHTYVSEDYCLSALHFS